MDTQRWSAILSRISPRDADDLDAVLGGFDPRHNPLGKDVFPRIDASLAPLAEMKRADEVCIGLRVMAELEDACDRAMRLASFAVERDVEIIVLAHCDRTGLERYGFRSERIAGETPEARAACEQQARRFWNIDLVL